MVPSYTTIFHLLLASLHISATATALGSFPSEENNQDVFKEEFDFAQYETCRKIHSLQNYRPDLALYNEYEDQECHMRDFQLLRKIASGGTAHVYKALFRGTHIVALKLIRHKTRLRFHKLFANEECAVGNLRHQAVPKFYCSVADGVYSAMAFELLDGWDGIDHLANSKSGQVTSDEFLEALTASASLLNMLHLSGVVYRDFKPDNMMFLRSGGVKIFDFGFLEPVTSVTTVAGTLEYLAPECFPRILSGNSLGTLDPSLDWYGLGLSLYIFAMGHMPFYRDEFNNIAVAIQAGIDPAFLPKGPVGQLIAGLTRRDPRFRWDFKNITVWLKHHVSNTASFDYPLRASKIGDEIWHPAAHFPARIGLDSKNDPQLVESATSTNLAIAVAGK